MNVDYTPAIPMFVDESRVFIDANPSFAIVIHKTAGMHSAQDVAAMFATTPARTSVHFIVGLDGVVVQCVALKDGAGGNCCVEVGFDPLWNQFVQQGLNLNFVTISIEHVDPALDNSTPITKAQKDSSFALVQWLCHKYSLPSSRIMTHASIAPSSRARCPGNYPMDELRAFIGDFKVPQGWSDDGAILKSPNGVPITGPFRTWVGMHNWDSSNWALESVQHYDTNMELSHPQLGGGDSQVFRLGRLEYQPATGVFEGWLGQEYIYLRNKQEGK